MTLRTCPFVLVLSIVACGPEKPEDTDAGTTTGAGSTGATSMGATSNGATSDAGPTSTSSTEPGCPRGWEPCVDDLGDFSCCMVPDPGTCPDPNSTYVEGECFCNAGYEWCSPDPDDLSCCEQGATSGTTTGSEPGCPGAVAPPPTCDPGAESFYCTNPASCGPQGGEMFVCMGGTWQPTPPAELDQQCMLDGFDFAFGCVDTGDGVTVECGSGPGTPCAPDAGGCSDDMKTLMSCKWGKTTAVDCFAQCTEVGDEMGVLYDFGSCGEQNGELACVCCDQGDPGCPI